MSNPWHGEIAALSPPHLIRDNMAGGGGGGGGGGGMGRGGVMER